MYHWGKIICACAGYVISGPVGLAIGFAIGFVIDWFLSSLQAPGFTTLRYQDFPELEQYFFPAIFTAMGYVAKASGQHDPADHRSAHMMLDIMGFPEHFRPDALYYFDQGRAPNFKLDDLVLRFYGGFRKQPAYVKMFVEIQVFASLLDGPMHPNARSVILNICRLLDLRRSDFDSFHRMAKVYRRRLSQYQRRDSAQGRLQEAYAVLNTSPDASDDEVKKAYMRLRSEHHPDKLMARGLSQEMIEIAEAKSREVRAAYECIKDLRKFS